MSEYTSEPTNEYVALAINKPISVDYEYCIPFYDVDAMRIAWHGHYVKYFEDARCALLDAIDYGYVSMGKSGYSWPIIDLQIKYAHPLRFGQNIIITATIKDIDNGLQIVYQIRDKASGQRLTKGSTRQVAVSLSDEEMQLCSPPVLYEKIAAYYHTKEQK